MRAYGIKIPVVLMAMAGALLLLFGAQFIYSRQAVEQPLVSIRHSVPSVENVAVQNTPSGLDVKVRLGLVPNLPETYRTLESQVGSVLGGQRFHIHLLDARTPTLLNDFYQMNGVLEQGIATGQFVTMENQVRTMGAQDGLTQASAIVDDHYVYVELVQGKHYLYELLPRQATTTAASAAGGS